MKNYRNRTSFFIISITSVFIYIIYFVFFQSNPQELFICDVYSKNVISFGSIDLEFLYPFNRCDDKIYLNTLLTIENIFSEGNNPYQNRPVYLFFNYLIYQILFFFIKENNPFLSFLPEITYFVSQLMYFVLGVFIIIKVLAKYFSISKFDLFLITILFSLNPLMQFGVFTPSNHTLSFLVFVVSVYLLENLQTTKQLFFYSSLLGILFLLNRSFFIGLVSINIFFLYSNRYNYKILISNMASTLFFFIPNFLYKRYLSFREISLYDINTEYYGHFIWLSKYFDQGIGYWISKIFLPNKLFELRFTKSWNTTDEWYCQNLPENFACYVNDSLELLKYLIIPVLLVIIFLFHNKLKSKVIKNVILVGVVAYVFWSFIGWYPPIRFNLYSLGNFLFVLLVIGYINLEFIRYKLLYFTIVVLYLFNIIHWNNPNLFSFSSVNILLLLAVIFFGLISFTNIFKTKPYRYSFKDNNKHIY